MRTRRQALPAIDELLGSIYDSLVEDVPLTSAVEGISTALRCHVVGLHHEEIGHRGRMELGGALSLSEMADLSETYAQRYQGQNLWIERGAAMLQSRGLQSTDESFPLPELFESSYYRHVLRRMDVQHAIGINVRQRAGRTLAVLSFNRAACAGPMSQDEIRLASELRPHLVNAYAVYDRLEALRDCNASLRSGFDAAPIGMLAFDASARVLELNAAASALLDGGHGIALLPGGELRLARLASRAALSEALVRLTRSAASLPESVLVSRVAEGAAANLVLHLCAAPSGSLRPRARVIGFLVDLDRGADDVFSRHALQAVFGLTAQESGVALALRRSGDPAVAALHLGIGLSTVRTHLKHIFRKVGVGRQGELVRIVDRIVGTAPG